MAPAIPNLGVFSPQSPQIRRLAIRAGILHQKLRSILGEWKKIGIVKRTGINQSVVLEDLPMGSLGDIVVRYGWGMESLRSTGGLGRLPL